MEYFSSPLITQLKEIMVSRSSNYIWNHSSHNSFRMLRQKKNLFGALQKIFREFFSKTSRPVLESFWLIETDSKGTVLKYHIRFLNENFFFFELKESINFFDVEGFKFSSVWNCKEWNFESLCLVECVYIRVGIEKIYAYLISRASALPTFLRISKRSWNFKTWKIEGAFWYLRKI